MTKNRLWKNYWKLIVLSLFKIDILEPLVLKCVIYIMKFQQASRKRYSLLGIKTNIILETGQTLMLQKLDILIMVLWVLDILILRSTKL